MTAPRGSGLAAAARSLPWRLLLPSAVILLAAGLTPTSELHGNQGDIGLYLEKARSLAAGLIPYRDFPLEYPPLALVPMVAPFLLWPFQSLTLEGYAWLFVAWEATLMLVLAIVLARIVRLGGARGDVALDARSQGVEPARVDAMADRLVLLSIGAALAIAFRFDLFPALLVMVGLWLSLERRPVAAGVAVGLGVLAKLYPLAVVPALAIPWLVPLDARRLVRYGVAVVASIVLVLLPLVALAGTDTFGFLSYQAERGLQVESVGGGLAVLFGLLAAHPVDMSFGFSAVQVAGPFADAWLAVLPALTVVGFALLGWIGWRHLRRGHVPPATAVTAHVRIGAGAARDQQGLLDPVRGLDRAVRGPAARPPVLARGDDRRADDADPPAPVRAARSAAGLADPHPEPAERPVPRAHGVVAVGPAGRFRVMAG